MAVLRHEDVLGLDVAVDDPLARGRRRAPRPPAWAISRARRTGTGPRPTRRSQRLAFEKLRHRVADAVRLADVVEGEDVRVRESRDGPGLALEAGEGLRVGRDGVGEDLDRDVAASRVSRAR